MQEREPERCVIYANEVSISAGAIDSVITFRWITPQYDQNKQIIGTVLEKEVAVSISSELLKLNAGQILTLFQEVDKNKDNNSNLSN